MNSNRKKNLRKLVRDLISAVTVMSSISGASTKATETEPPRKEEKSQLPAWVTPAVLGVGLGSIGLINWIGNNNRLETERELNSQEFALRQKEAQANLQKKENKAILEKNGMQTNDAAVLCATINKIKTKNHSKKWITTDDLITALNHGGQMTRDVLMSIYRVPHVNDETEVGNKLLETLANYFTNSDKNLSKLKEAVNTLTSSLKDAGEVKQSTLLITAQEGAVANEGNWHAWGNNPRARTKKLPAANQLSTMNWISSKEYAPKNGNYAAADKLMPPELANVVGDMIWCGIGTSFLSANEDQITLPVSNDNNIRSTTYWSSIENVDNAKKTLKNAHVPMYLSMTCKRDDFDKNTGKLDGATVWSIPLYDENWDKRGGEKGEEIMPNVAKWIMGAGAGVTGSDRVSQDDAEWK